MRWRLNRWPSKPVAHHEPFAASESEPDPMGSVILGFCTLLVAPRRWGRKVLSLKTSTLLRLDRVLVKRKYRLLSSSGPRRRPGPKGPSRELIDAVVEMKRRNPYFGCRKIAEHLLAPSALRSRSMPSGAFWLGTIHRNRMAAVPPGSRLSDTPRTACGASISSVPNQSCSRVTGFWW